MVAHNSHLNLTGSTFSYNRAKFGGVMVTRGSTIKADFNIFINNEAENTGAVMVTYNDTVTFSSTTFTNNSAVKYGGVVDTYGKSLININNSVLLTTVWGLPVVWYKLWTLQ